MVWFAQTNTGNIAKFDPLTETFTEYDNPVWTELEQSFILSAIENNVPPQKLRSMMWGMDAFPDGSIWYTSRIPIQAEDNNVYFIGVLWKFSKDTGSYDVIPYSEEGNYNSLPQKLSIEGSKIILNDFTAGNLSFLDYAQDKQGLMHYAIPA